jgi:excisionase family DNA binding protein
MRPRKTDSQLPAANGKLLLSIDEAAALMSLGRSAMYALVMRSEVASIKVGRMRRIPLSALQAFVTRQLSDLEKGA